MHDAFKAWVKEIGGPEHLAVALEMTSVSVRNWLSKKSSPSARNAMRIVELSKGKVKFDDLLFPQTLQSKSDKRSKKSVVSIIKTESAGF